MKTPPEPVRDELRRLRRKLNRALVLGGAVRGAMVGLTLAGAFLLYTRAYATPAREFAWLVAPVCLCSALIGLLLTRRDFYTEAQTVSLLDRRTGARGLVLAVSQAASPVWSERAAKLVRDVQVEPVAYNWPRFSKRLLPFMLFLGLVLLVPPRLPIAVSNTGFAIAQSSVKRIQDMLQVLAEEELLTEERIEEYANQLEELKEKSSKGITSRQWEALDSLNNALTQELQQASDRLQRGRSSMAQAGAGANEGEMKMDTRVAMREDTNKALDELESSRLLKRLTREGQKALQEAQKNLEAGAAAQPSEADKKLLENLRDLDNDLAQKQERLEEAYSSGDRGAGGGSAPPNLDDYAMNQTGSETIPDFGSGGDGGQGESEGSGRGEGQGVGFGQGEGEGLGEGGGDPGRGGISRGRGDARLTWKKQSDKKGAAFKAVPLPPGWKLDKSGRLVYAVTASEPNVNDPAAAVAAKARAFDADPGGVAWKSNISPRSRGVVKRYFSNDSSD